MYNLQLFDDAIADYENAIVWYEIRNRGWDSIFLFGLPKPLKP